MRPAARVGVPWGVQEGGESAGKPTAKTRNCLKALREHAQGANSAEGLQSKATAFSQFVE
eukprot:6637998-Alexandrium_andersonii.AAC.1